MNDAPQDRRIPRNCFNRPEDIRRSTDIRIRISKFKFSPNLVPLSFHIIHLTRDEREYVL